MAKIVIKVVCCQSIMNFKFTDIFDYNRAFFSLTESTNISSITNDDETENWETVGKSNEA